MNESGKNKNKIENEKSGDGDTEDEIGWEKIVIGKPEKKGIDNNKCAFNSCDKCHPERKKKKLDQKKSFKKREE